MNNGVILSKICEYMDTTTVYNLSLVNKDYYKIFLNYLYDSLWNSNILYCSDWRDMRKYSIINLYRMRYFVRGKSKLRYIKDDITTALNYYRSSNRMGLTNEQKRLTESKSESEYKIVQAYAGSGKTTSLYNLCLNNPEKRIIYLAFNKSIETSAKNGNMGSLPNVDIYTFHSYVLEVLTRNNDFEVVNDYSITDLREYLNMDDDDTSRMFLKWIRNYINKFFQSSSSHPSQMYSNSMVNNLTRLWELIRTFQIPLTHDGYLKLFDTMKMKMTNKDGYMYDMILLDEAQDSSECMLRILRRQKCIKVLIGDTYQQIYIFRGAVDPFSRIKESNKIEYEYYELNTTFRFGPDVADLSTRFLRKFMNNNNITIKSDNIYDTRIFSWRNVSFRSKPHTVLFFTNMGLFEYANSLAQEGISFNILQNEIDYGEEAQIVRDLLNLKNGILDEIVTQELKDFKTFREVERYMTDYDVKIWLRRIEWLNLYDIDLVRHYTNINNYLDPSSNILLSTVHKSKGLEFDVVKLANDFPMLTINEKVIVKLDNTWKQNYNTYYVAMTRAKEELYLNIQLNDWINITNTKEYRYSTGKNNTCRKCGIVTNLLENKVCTCHNCAYMSEYL